MGPIDVVVLSFPNTGLMSGITPLLERLTASGLLRIVDAVIASEAGDGAVTVTDLEDDILPRWSTISPDPRPLLSSSDAELVIEEIGQDGTALVLAIEHVWSDVVARTALDSGGMLQLHVRVSQEIVDAAALVDS